MTPKIVLAPGAGAPSSSAWMRRFAELLGAAGDVQPFDYPYMRAGARRAPDRLPVLVEAHRAEVEGARATAEPNQAILLAGKSMGGRVGCHVSLETRVAGLICFGYPLRGQNGKLRDEVLLALATPVLFVQGTRDELCSLSELEPIRKRMTARSELFVVEGGDHSLEVSKTMLKTLRTTQADVEKSIQQAVLRFCESL